MINGQSMGYYCTPGDGHETHSLLMIWISEMLFDMLVTVKVMQVMPRFKIEVKTIILLM